VALLAFNKIVATHPFLVAQQEDVILECIDSEDITIRIKALDLVQGMVSGDNLISVVSRLMRQLKAASSTSANQRNGTPPPDPEYYSDEEDDARNSRSPKAEEQAPPLPEDYTVDVIARILNMCSRNNYSNLSDFDWYIDVLIQLIRIAPVPRQRQLQLDLSSPTSQAAASDISEKIGDEIRNIAVKVKAVRYAAVRAADAVIIQLNSESSSTQHVVSGVLKPAAWIVGEYASQLPNLDDTLGCLLQLIPRTKEPELLAATMQSALKILALVAGDEQAIWTPERKSRISLLLARVIHTLEPLTSHPYLEAQERAVEFTELLKLAAEAASGQAAATDEVHQDPPLLLTQALPSLFSGWELNSVAVDAQLNVPAPVGLDLDEPIHPNLNKLLAEADSLMLPTEDEDEFEAYYNKRPPPSSITNEPAINKLAEPSEEVVGSYQRAGEESYLDPDIVARRKAERQERNKDDPFYIQGAGRSQGTSTPIHNILQDENGPVLDIDSIPIMQLDLEKLDPGLGDKATIERPASRPKPRQKVTIAADETLGGSGRSTPRLYESENGTDIRSRSKKLAQSLLKVDSSHIGSLSLNPDQPSSGGYDFEQQQREEMEMAQAVKEVERLRLEMQRANERIQVAQGIPAEGTVLKKKKPKKPKADDEEGTVVKVKKKKKKPAVIEEGGGNGDTGVDAATEVVKPKKKKRVKRVVEPEDQGEPAAQ